MKVIDVKLLRNSLACGYVLQVFLESGFIYHIHLSQSYFHSHPDFVHFFTVSGFISRPKFPDRSLSFWMADGNLYVSLPTCCGYVSSRGKWLTTGSFHYCLAFYIDGFISSL